MLPRRLLLIESLGQGPTPDTHYVGVVLTDKSRGNLLKALPPRFNNVKADHVTLDYSPDEDTFDYYKKLIAKSIKRGGRGKPARQSVVNFHATHHAVTPDEGDAAHEGYNLHAVRVGGLDHLHPRDHKHIMISVGKDSKPAQSNDLLSATTGERLRKFIPLTGKLALIPKVAY